MLDHENHKVYHLPLGFNATVTELDGAIYRMSPSPRLVLVLISSQFPATNSGTDWVRGTILTSSMHPMSITWPWPMKEVLLTLRWQP